MQPVVLLKVTNESNIKRLKELEEKLEAERRKVESLEADSNKLFETEEALLKSKEEIDFLKADLEHHRDKRSILESERAVSAGKFIKHDYVQSSNLLFI